ncbi:MAG: Na(+)/H(+) antiporter subunit D [Phascolarctobacterium sp.]
MNELMLHPGLILWVVGIVAMLSPKVIRKFVLALGPLAAVGAALKLPIGTEYTLNFVRDIQLHLMYVDKLAWIFGFIFSVLALVSGIYAAHNPNRMEALCSMAYAGGAICVCFAKDWLSFIFFWESLAVTSLFLVWCNPTHGARRAGFRYMLVHMLGGGILLAGIFCTWYTGHGDLMIHSFTNRPHDWAYWLVMTGMFVNVAMPPVNAWLVDAYSNSTLTGGVFMSCLTTKVAVYALIRVFAGTELLMWGGVLMALYGACYAIMENDMRKLLAHHIISQTGFMVAGAGIGTAMSMNGATAHAFCDILFKSLLFMCAGAVIYATGIKHINKVGGMAKKLPLVAVCFFSAAFSIAGIPAFNGFISKNITVNAAVAAGQPMVFTLLELAAIGTFLSIPLKMGYFIFLRKDDKGAEIINPLPINMKIAMSISGFLCFLYGVYPDLLYRHLPFEMTPYQPFTAPHLLQPVQMLGMAMIPFMMYLKNMEPHTAISLDTDWFYRKPFAELIGKTSALLCALCGGLGNAWQVLYEKFMDLTANPMDFLDAKPFRKRSHYNPENYRTSIADPMMITLTVLVSSIAYFIATMQ